MIWISIISRTAPSLRNRRSTWPAAALAALWLAWRPRRCRGVNRGATRCLFWRSLIGWSVGTRPIVVAAPAMALLSAAYWQTARAEIIIDPNEVGSHRANIRLLASAFGGGASGDDGLFEREAPIDFTSFSAGSAVNASHSGPNGSGAGMATGSASATITLANDVLTVQSTASFNTAGSFMRGLSPEDNRGLGFGSGDFSFTLPIRITERSYEYSFSGQAQHDIRGDGEASDRSRAQFRFSGGAVGNLLNLNDDHRSGSGTVPVSGSGTLAIGPSHLNRYDLNLSLDVSAGSGPAFPDRSDAAAGSLSFLLTIRPVDENIVRWTNAGGGAFGTTSNWNPQRVPEKSDTRSDIALFDLDQVYTVSVDGSRTVEQLIVRDGRVQFTGNTLTAVGLSAVPSVSVENDGRLNVVDGQLRSLAAIIGNAPPSDPQNPLTAEVLVSNTPTEWIADGNIAVGGAGKGRLFVANGAEVTSSAATIGGPFGGEATVGGEDSKWTTGNLAVGIGGGPGVLNVEAGGRVDSAEGVIGQGSGVGSRVIVTGHDPQKVASLWNTTGNLRVGAAGSGRLEVTAGGSATAGRDLLIADGSANTGTVIVSGIGNAPLTAPADQPRSFLGAARNLLVGRGGVAELFVEGGAQAFFVNDVVIGDLTQGTVTVRGTAAMGTIRSELFAGGLLAVGEQDHGRLVIEGGAEVLSNEGRVGSDIATPGDTTSGEVFIRGGSQWRVNANLDVGIEVASAGRMTMEGGHLEVGGTLTVGPRGTLLGIGTVNAANRVRNGGVVSPGLSPGKLTITGDYEQTAAGQLDLEIGGLTPEVQHDQLAVSGNVTMAGVLNLIFRDRFAPRMGDQFTLLPVGGTFTDAGLDVNIVNLAPGFEYDLMLTGGAMTLVAKNDATFVPEPSMLGMLSAAILMWRRRELKPALAN